MAHGCASTHSDMSLIENVLTRIADFIDFHKEFINAHMVDFFTKCHWDTLIPKNVATELMHFREEYTGYFGTKEFFDLDYVRGRHAPGLAALMEELCRNTLEAQKICTDIDGALPDHVKKCWSGVTFSSHQMDWQMSKKKSHEVAQMGSFIAAFAHSHKILHVVDVGSGKGYLSSNLASHHGLNALGIELADHNNCNAQARNSRMVRHTSRLNAKNTVKTQACHCSDGSSIAQPSRDADDSSPNTGTFHTLTAKIDYTFDLSGTLRQHFGQEVCNVLLCGLHTCGDLASCVLRLFVRCNIVKHLCLVSCCYNLMTEEQEAAGDDSRQPHEFGFPLSSCLRQRECSLGRNARMLASQSIARLRAGCTDLPESLFHRALFQKIITDKLGDEMTPNSFSVGKLSAKSSSFSEYVRKAIARLKMPDLQVTDQEAEQYELDYQHERKKVMLFQKLRISFASCIEEFILLDRLMYLREQEGVENAHIIQLFDPVASPRCYALVATKKA